MDLKELKHIERAMELIENRDENFKDNVLWKQLRIAQDLWYRQKAKEEYDLYMHKFELSNDIKFKQIAEANMEFYNEEREKL